MSLQGAPRQAIILVYTSPLKTLNLPLKEFHSWGDSPLVVDGLLLFGVIFAVNSSLHSYLIISMARADGVSLNAGFHYYISNARGRWIGTALSGWVNQVYWLDVCLWVSLLFLQIATVPMAQLPDPAQAADSAD